MIRLKNISESPRVLRSNGNDDTRVWPAQMTVELTEDDADKFSAEIFAGMRTAYPAGHKRAGKLLFPWCVRVDEDGTQFVLAPNAAGPEDEIPFNARVHARPKIKLGRPRKPAQPTTFQAAPER